jgi:hypothetical protein
VVGSGGVSPEILEILLAAVVTVQVSVWQVLPHITFAFFLGEEDMIFFVGK